LKIGHPLVTVIMPTFNNIAVIENAVKSILAQTMSEWELIIVDDASSDGTANLITDKFTDKRIKLIRLERNLGSGSCRNIAIDNAKGEYVAILDADDESVPDRLEKQSNILKQRPDVTVVASQVLEFGDWGGPLSGTWKTDDATVLARQKAGKMPVPHPSVMMRRAAILEVGGYDTACRRAQDYALFLRLANKKIVCIAEPLVKYRTDRPISIAYAIKNEMYADLARSRYSLWLTGAPASELPTRPNMGITIVVRALRGWGVRRCKEFILQGSLFRR
jgi:glycosyltransferase involved in cell wall biosynthesis